MKIKFLCFLITLSLIITATSLFANATDKEIINVAYFPENIMIRNLNATDHKGLGYDVLSKMEVHSNFKFKYIAYESMGEAFEALENGTVDILGCVAREESREEYLEYFPVSFGIGQMILVANDDDKVFYDDPSYIDGKTIATYAGNPYKKYLDLYCEENNITVEYVEGTFLNHLELDADIYFTTSLHDKMSDKQSILNLTPFDYYIVAQKGNTQLIDELYDAFSSVLSDDGDLLTDLDEIYYHKDNIVKRGLTREEQELLASKEFSVGFIDDYEPIHYLGDDGVTPEGIGIDILNAIAYENDIKLNYVPYTLQDPKEEHENFDILLSIIGDGSHDKEFYNSTQDYMTLPLMFLTQPDTISKASSSEHETKIGMFHYVSINYNDVISEFPNNEIILYDNLDNLINAYKNNEIDGIIATNTITEYVHKALESDQLRIYGTSLTLSFQIMISKQLSRDYVVAFNVLFDHLSNNTYNEIVTSYTEDFSPPYSITSFIKDNIISLLVLAVIVIIIVSGSIVMSVHRRRKTILGIINTDELTGLYSVYKFKEIANSILEKDKISIYEIISFDIDSFKTINSIYSRERGNEVIKSIAHSLRLYSEPRNIIISRVVANEFIILLKSNENANIKSICNNIVIPAIKDVLGQNYHASLSVGIYKHDRKIDSAITIDKMLDFANIARLKGKHLFKNTYFYYDNQMQQDEVTRTQILFTMKQALQDGEFTAEYQPKIDLNTSKINGAEALVRWYSKSGQKKFFPNDFIPLFESNGFVVDIDFYVFEEVCKFIFNNSSKVNIPVISTNLSAITLFDNRFPNILKQILDKYDLSPQRIRLEITESAMNMDENALIKKVEQIKKLGFTLSMDDFGAGVSSLNRLRAIEVDEIKIDKAFLDYNEGNDRGTIIVEDVIDMAKHLKMKVVCEGIETKQQALWLKSLNCDVGQGYYFSRPIKEHEFLDLLMQDKNFL